MSTYAPSIASSSRTAVNSSSFLNLSVFKKQKTVSEDQEAKDRLEKRRAINRNSQRKGRELKEKQIRQLEEENARLKAQVAEASKSPQSQPSSSHASSLSPQSHTHSHSHSHSQSLSPTPVVPSVNLHATRQAFLAVLASPCDGHLNTIHAVCSKWSESRGGSVALPLNPPKAPDYSLKLLAEQSFMNLFDNLLPPPAFVPDQQDAGPLSIPFLEPAHPVNNIEFDAVQVWEYALTFVNFAQADAEGLASKLTEKVRCYGFGPVVLIDDVVRVCSDYPQLIPSYLISN